MKPAFWRPKTLNVQRSIDVGWMQYDLGSLRAGVVVRIPVFVALWLKNWQEVTQRRRDIRDEDAVKAAGVDRASPRNRS